MKNKKSGKAKNEFEALDRQLTDIKSDLPVPRPNLSEQDLDELVRKIGGPKTVNSILKAKENLPLARIPWLFSSIDPQLIIDLLHYAESEVLRRVLDGVARKH